MTLRMSNTSDKVHTVSTPSNLSLNIPEEYATSISMAEASPEQLSLFDNVTLGIQESTMQVPCGDYSILDPFMKVPAFNQAVYLYMNWKSQWEYGITHAISNSTIAEGLGVKCKSQVNRAIKWLIKHGWVKVHGKRKKRWHFFLSTDAS